jgi:DNA mismatch repair protein MutL
MPPTVPTAPIGPIATASLAGSTAAPLDPVPPRIAILPPELADQIAAGEVVERAASAVKELCENALDAGARHVDVELEGGGRGLIRVVDDGCGMTPAEARLALRRHATSKIAHADDLWTLKSFGFRGEALPSIAAVSRLTLSTRVAGASAGFRLVVEAGVETDAREVGMPPGTRVEVRDLFYNTPARLKFQKADATEAGNVSDAVLRLGLAHPESHLRLSIGGRLALDLPPHRDRAERVRAALARRGLGALHEVLGEEAGHRVHAFLAAPSQATSTARGTFLFVGRRFVRDRGLLQAVVQGYGDALERGRYPVAVVFLEVPGSELDVNVHPQKLEVRFARGAEVYAAVRHVLREGLRKAPWMGMGMGIVGSGAGSFDGDRGAGAGRGPAPFSPPPPELGPRAGGRDPVGPMSVSVSVSGSLVGWARSAGSPGHRDDTPAGVATRPGELSPAMSGLLPTARDAGSKLTEKTARGAVRLLGQLDLGCWVCESGEALVLFDPHAVRERVLLRALEAEWAAGQVQGQKLLFPIPIGWTPPAVAPAPGEPRDTAAEATFARAVARLGVEVEPPRAPRPDTWVLRGLPAVLGDAAPKPVLLGLLLRWFAPPRATEAPVSSPLPSPGGLEESAADLLGVMACAASVRPGEAIDGALASDWLGQLAIRPWPPTDGQAGPAEQRPDTRADADAVAVADLDFVCRRGRPLCLPITFAALRAHFGPA